MKNWRDKDYLVCENSILNADLLFIVLQGKQIIVSVLRRYRRHLGISQNKQNGKVSTLKTVVTGGILLGSAIFCINCVSTSSNKLID